MRRVCEYVAERKETSKAGSVLILRFFHNYFPAEIASSLRTSRQAVEIWLLNARRESRLFLEDPDALKLIDRRKPGLRRAAPRSRRAGSEQSSDITCELRDCATRDEWRDLYESGSGQSIACARLAHLVSCGSWLETVNELLGLPSSAERYPFESSDSGAPPSDVGGPPGASGSGSSQSEIGKRLRRRRRETIEHRPQELRIAVNGFFVGGQKVGLPVNELTLELNLEEQISFVEVFSEQGLLLSHFKVTPPTDGEIQQREEVEFGEGRALELAVSYGGTQRFDAATGTLKVCFVLANRGDDPLKVPIKVQVDDLKSDLGAISASGSTNGLTGVGAIWDISEAVMGNQIPPRSSSGPFRLSFHVAANAKAPRFKMEPPDLTVASRLR